MRRFPVMRPYAERRKLGEDYLPRDIPWSVVAPFAQRAVKNHDQTLERLAERGGLSAYELRCLLSDEDLFPLHDDLTADVLWVKNYLQDVVGREDGG